MNDFFEIEVTPGKLRFIYQEGVEKLAKDIGGVISKIGRASHVEWENGHWVVRSARNPKYAIRVLSETETSLKMHVSNKGKLVTFNSKEEALYWERELFWGLLRGGKRNV